MIIWVQAQGERIELELNQALGEVRIGGKVFSYRREGDLLFVGDKPFPYDCLRDDAGFPRSVLFRGKLFQLEVERHKGEEHRGGADGEVHAPLNGQVVKVSRVAGDRVEKGEVILTLEAMKMENELAAPFAGILKAIHPQPGQVVKAGELLFQIEPLVQ